MKHFAKLQAKDDQAPIRCNTTICLGKLLTHLNKETKQKVMNSAFNRAMKDPFPPARQAGLNAILANADEYTLPDLAMKMLPGVTPLLCDREKNVRTTALKAARMFLTKIENASNDPDKERELLGLKPHESLNPQVSETACSSEAGKPQTTTSAAYNMASGWMSSAKNYAGDLAKKVPVGANKNASASGNNSSSSAQPSKPKTLNQLSNNTNSSGILQPTKANVAATSSANYDNWDDDASDYGDGDDGGNGWDDPADGFDDLDLYGGSSTPNNNSSKKQQQATLSSTQIKLAKNDLAAAKSNMSNKRNNKNKEADIWDDFGMGGTGTKSKNDDLIDWGEPSTASTANKTSSNNNSGWDDNWDAKPVNTSNILKPTKARNTSRKPVKKQTDDWGEW